MQKCDIAHIGEQLGNSSASCKAVWLALLTIANDRGEMTFTARIALIGHLAACSYNTALRAVSALEDLGKVKIDRHCRGSHGRPESEHTYTLLPYTNSEDGSPENADGSTKFGDTSPSDPTNGLQTGYKKDKEKTPLTPQSDRARRKKRGAVIEVSLPDSLDRPEFKTIWTDFLSHRRQLKKPLTEIGAKRLLTRCEREGIDRAVKALSLVLEHCWQAPVWDHREMPKGDKPAGVNVGHGEDGGEW